MDECSEFTKVHERRGQNKGSLFERGCKQPALVSSSDPHLASSGHSKSRYPREPDIMPVCFSIYAFECMLNSSASNRNITVIIATCF